MEFINGMERGTMDSRQIGNFLAVYEAQSMRIAARQRYISEQGLSKSIKSLEDEMGVPLFTRTRTGVVPTAAGQCFYEYAVKAKESLSQLKANLEVLADGRRELRLPCSYGALHCAYRTIQAFEEEHPEIGIRWIELDDRRAERMVTSGEAPLGLLVRSPEAEHAIEYVPLCSSMQSLLVFEGHPLYQKDAIEYRDLEGVPLALEGSDFHVNRSLMESCLEAGFVPDIEAETSDMTLCLRLAAVHECCSIVPSFIAEEWPLPGVRAIPFADGGYRWELSLGWLREHRPRGDPELLATYLVDHRDDLKVG